MFVPSRLAHCVHHDLKDGKQSIHYTRKASFVVKMFYYYDAVFNYTIDKYLYIFFYIKLILVLTLMFTSV